MLNGYKYKRGTKMNKSESGSIKIHRKVGASTTLNRKYVARPASKISAEKAAADYRAEQLKRRQELAEKMNREATIQRLGLKHPLQVSANEKLRERKAAPVIKKKTAAELKEEAIKKALTTTIKKTEEKPALKTKSKISVSRIFIALACAAASVFAIAYLVKINMPDLSLRVAAAQSGIEAKYPNYTPENYLLNGITSESGKVTISFKNGEKTFNLSEEKTSWNSTALLNNYVKKEYSENYDTVKERGLTIYITDEKASWVNGGILYKLFFDKNSLDKSQICSLATSL